MHDCMIIGGGHNGLTCAARLAKSGLRVRVLERRPLVGGACVTEQLWPGYRVNTAAYVVSLLLPEIERELELARHGYEVIPRSPSSFTPLEDGRYLMLGSEAGDEAAISQFSADDAAAFPRYEALLTRIAERLEPALIQPPPGLLPTPQTGRRPPLWEQFGRLRRGWDMYAALKSLGPDLPEAIELLAGSATAVLDRWFTSDVLKGTLATDAIIGTFQPPSAPGTGYVLLHHVMGSSGGERGVWGYVRGGMGRLSEALAASAREAGAEIRVDAPVSKISQRDDRTFDVHLTGGEVLRSKSVASSVDALTTFTRFVEPDALPDEFVSAVRRIDYSSASLKINLAVNELPDFTCLPGRETPGPQHRGTIHFNCLPEQIERAYDDAKYGSPSRQPVIEMTIPSSVDDSLAPPGHHIVSLFVQYAPYRLRGGSWDELKESFADTCVAEIGRYAPNFPDSVLHRQVLSPVDLERTFGLTGGNIFQGAMSLHQLGDCRPVLGWSDYRTPLDGFYLCGSAAHPGGGVMGACGWNAAAQIIRDTQ